MRRVVCAIVSVVIGCKPAPPPPAATIDPAVRAELAKVQSCVRDDLGNVDACSAFRAFTEYATNYVERDDANHDKTRTLVTSCLASLSDPDDRVREAAADCARRRGITVLIDAESARRALAACVRESTPTLRNRICAAVAAARPVLAGIESDVVAQIRSLKANVATRETAAQLLASLGRAQPAPPTEELALAAELLNGATLAQETDALGFLTDAMSSTACHIITTWLVTARRTSDGMRAIAQIGQPCTGELAAVVDDAVRRIALDNAAGDAEVEAEKTLELVSLTLVVRAKVLTGDQRAAIRVAAVAAAPTAPKHTTEYARLLAALDAQPNQ